MNVTRGGMIGFQQGLVNVSGVYYTGLLVNSMDAGEGVQFGLVNITQSLNGLRLGLINYAANLEGLQIGLINIIRTGGVLPVMPIVNWAF